MQLNFRKGDCNYIFFAPWQCRCSNTAHNNTFSLIHSHFPKWDTISFFFNPWQRWCSKPALVIHSWGTGCHKLTCLIIFSMLNGITELTSQSNQTVRTAEIQGFLLNITYYEDSGMELKYITNLVFLTFEGHFSGPIWTGQLYISIFSNIIYFVYPKSTLNFSW